MASGVPKVIGMAQKKSAQHNSRMHKLPGPHKQMDGWNMLAMSNGRRKLPDDHFGPSAAQRGESANLRAGTGGEEVLVLPIHSRLP